MKDTTVKFNLEFYPSDKVITVELNEITKTGGRKEWMQLNNIFTRKVHVRWWDTRLSLCKKVRKNMKSMLTEYKKYIHTIDELNYTCKEFSKEEYLKRQLLL